jgi:hypothetical protein
VSRLDSGQPRRKPLEVASKPFVIDAEQVQQILDELPGRAVDVLRLRGEHRGGEGTDVPAAVVDLDEPNAPLGQEAELVFRRGLAELALGRWSDFASSWTKALDFYEKVGAQPVILTADEC